MDINKITEHQLVIISMTFKAEAYNYVKVLHVQTKINSSTKVS